MVAWRALGQQRLHTTQVHAAEISGYGNVLPAGRRERLVPRDAQLDKRIHAGMTADVDVLRFLLGYRRHEAVPPAGRWPPTPT